MSKNKNKKNKNSSSNVVKKSIFADLKKYFPHLLLGLYLIEMLYLAIEPYDRGTWWAENIPVMIVVGLLIFTFRKFRFSNVSYFLMTFFLMLHTYGGHYSFALTPFDFFNNLLNYLNLDFIFPEGRNNFDRVGHFLVGVFAYPVAELLYRKKLVKNITVAIFFGIFALGFWGALYEVIEMYFAVIFGGESASDFLGSQGDIWDAQKDMWLDILGASMVSILFWWNYRRK